MPKNSGDSIETKLTVHDLVETLRRRRASLWLEQTEDFFAIGGGSKVMGLGQEIEEIDQQVSIIGTACASVGVQL